MFVCVCVCAIKGRTRKDVKLCNFFVVVPMNVVSATITRPYVLRVLQNDTMAYNYVVHFEIALHYERVSK